MSDPVQIILTTTETSLARFSLSHPGAVVVSVVCSRVARDGVEVVADAFARRLLVILAARSPGVVSKAEIIDILWGDDPDGGPDNPDSRLSNLAQRVKFLGAALGVVVRTVHGRGYYLRAVKPDAVAETRALAELEETAA